MFIISHRGNLDGPNFATENTSKQIDFCIANRVPVEIDVWKTDSGLFLGHDEPAESIRLDYLFDRCHSLWIHCKNSDAFDYLTDFEILNVFWHQNDDYTLTSHGHIWTYPKVNTVAKSVIVCQDEVQTLECLKKSIKGICTDFVNLAKSNYK